MRGKKTIQLGEFAVTLMVKPPDFSFTSEDISSIAEKAIAALELNLARIVQIPRSDRTFQNTVLAFEAAADDFSDATEIPQFLSRVSPDAEVRKAAEQLAVKTGRYMVDVFTRKDVFDALNEYARKKETLSPVDSRLLEKRLRDFKKNGLGLDAAKTARLRVMFKELVGLSSEFHKNIREFADTLELREEELSGLPADYKARLKRTPGGGYLVGTDYSDYTPFMENAENADARRRLYQLFNDRCAGRNVELLEKALDLRRKIAKTLGYASFADFVLEDRMAKNSASVVSFLERLQARLKFKARRELAERRRLKADKTPLASWETAYYSNLLRKTKHAIDHQKIREYFPLATVLNGMFEVFGEMLGFRVCPAKLPVWHPDVLAYEVRNADGSLAAYLYMDLFPRFGKYKNPNCTILRDVRKSGDGSYTIPAVAVLSNFSPAGGDLPVLLKFSEVESLFHEFGHVLQLLLCRSQYTRLAAINAAWDFIEVPSTVLQQYVYEPAVLRRISGHYADERRRLPEDVIGRLIAARNESSGLYYLRLAALSMIDMRYHTARGKLDTTKTYQRLMKKISLVGIIEGTHPQAGFGHLMPAYAAGYYSYLWSEVIAADLFGEFRAAGGLSPGIGAKYRREILEQGASRDESVSIEKFLSRPVSEETFLAAVSAV